MQPFLPISSHINMFFELAHLSWKVEWAVMIIIIKFWLYSVYHKTINLGLYTGLFPKNLAYYNVLFINASLDNKGHMPLHRRNKEYQWMSNTGTCTLHKGQFVVFFKSYKVQLNTGTLYHFFFHAWKGYMFKICCLFDMLLFVFKFIDFIYSRKLPNVMHMYLYLLVFT